MEPHDAKLRCLPIDWPWYGGWPVMPNDLGSVIRIVANQLLENEWRDPADIHARQFRQLRTLLAHAGQYSPFHAERFRAASLVPEDVKSIEDFRRFPLMGRADLQDGYERILARRLPDGTQFSGEVSSSGSSGAPVHVRTTNYSDVTWAALNLRNYAWQGIDPRGKLAVIRFVNRDALPAAYTPEGGQLLHWGGPTTRCLKTGPAAVMHIEMPVDVQVDFLLRSEADYLLTFPWNLAIVRERLQERGLTPPRLKVIQTVAELLKPEARRAAEETFSARIGDLYSCIEVGYIASDCPEGHGHHVHEENVLLEILDASGEPCRPGEAGRVVLTGLSNFGFPLIRYEVGDYAVAAEPGCCACGRQLMRLTEIIGRERGALIAQDGSKRFGSPMHLGLLDGEHIRQFQVIQHSRDRLQCRIVPKKGFGEEQRRIIVEAVRAYLGDGVEVEFEMVDSIARTSRGKYLDVICNAT